MCSLMLFPYVLRPWLLRRGFPAAAARTAVPLRCNSANVSGIITSYARGFPRGHGNGCCIVWSFYVFSRKSYSLFGNLYRRMSTQPWTIDMSLLSLWHIVESVLFHGSLCYMDRSMARMFWLEASTHNNVDHVIVQYQAYWENIHFFTLIVQYLLVGNLSRDILPKIVLAFWPCFRLKAIDYLSFTVQKYLICARLSDMITASQDQIQAYN